MEGSSFFVESKLDLGLGLGIGGRDASPKIDAEQRGRFTRIFTAQDTFSIVTSSSSASSATSSVCSSSSRANAGSWTQKHADSVRGGSNCASQSQIVGWPPVRVSRMNGIGKREKPDLSKCSSTLVGTYHGACKNSNANLKGKECGRSSLYVKVNMDGIPIGRKVNLIALTSYESLVQTLEDMFRDPTTSADGSGQFLNLLGGFSKYALTYEDKDGDWMLVGDVPWGDKSKATISSFMEVLVKNMNRKKSDFNSTNGFGDESITFARGIYFLNIDMFILRLHSALHLMILHSAFLPNVSRLREEASDIEIA